MFTSYILSWYRWLFNPHPFIGEKWQLHTGTIVDIVSGSSHSSEISYRLPGERAGFITVRLDTFRSYASPWRPTVVEAIEAHKSEES